MDVHCNWWIVNSVSVITMLKSPSLLWMHLQGLLLCCLIADPSAAELFCWPVLLFSRILDPPRLQHFCSHQHFKPGEGTSFLHHLHPPSPPPPFLPDTPSTACRHLQSDQITRYYRVVPSHYCYLAQWPAWTDRHSHTHVHKTKAVNWPTPVKMLTTSSHT